MFKLQLKELRGMYSLTASVSAKLEVGLGAHPNALLSVGTRLPFWHTKDSAYGGSPVLVGTAWSGPPSKSCHPTCSLHEAQSKLLPNGVDGARQGLRGMAKPTLL